MRIRASLITAIFLIGAFAAHASSSATDQAANRASSTIQIADEKDGWKERHKREHERAKKYREWERERRKHDEEMERESRKHREEMEREARKHRKERRRERYKHHHVQGPPPWAQAHGYRAKKAKRHKYRHRGRERHVSAADLVSLPSSGLGQCNRTVIGALLGAGAGGLLGSQFGKGSGKTVATIGGAILGAVVGGNVGRGMDQVDQNCVGQVLERAPTGQPVHWDDPDTGRQYQATALDTYQAKDGRYCREYRTTVVIGGQAERAYGTACRQPDGSWERVN